MGGLIGRALLSPAIRGAALPLALLAAPIPPVGAQEVPPNPRPGGAIVPPAVEPEAAPAFSLDVMGERHMLASRLGSAIVLDRHGREIGDVEDTVIDENGDVVALLVGIGGTLGLGEKPVAVRFEHVRVERGEEGEPRFVLDLDRADLDAAPAFTRFGE